MARLLVTGSSGFIGSAICSVALRKGYEVVGLSDKEPTVKGIEAIQGDITQPESVKDAMQGVDAVIHLAAITVQNEFEKDPRRCLQINVDGFANVIQQASEQGVRFLYASSSYVYPSTDFSETAPIDINQQPNIYARTKIMNEMIANFYAELHRLSSGERGIASLGLRFFNVYGIGEATKGPYTSVISKFAENKAKGEKIEVYRALSGEGGASKDMVNIKDVAEITVRLLETKETGVINVGTGVATPYWDIAQMIDSANAVWVKNPLSTYQTFTKADTTKLMSVLGGYKFVSIKDGVEEILRHKGLI